MFKLVQKLKKLKPVFRKASRESGYMERKVEGLKQQLESVQIAIDGDPNNIELKELEVQLVREYRTAALEAERMLKQKSQVHWLKVGDHNNKFFHNSLKVKSNSKRIVAIKNAVGDLVEGQAMVEQFVEFYTSLLGKEDNCESIMGLPQDLFKSISGIQAEEMVREVSKEEIKGALFSIGDDKAPGPDGFTSRFFKSAWGVIEDDFCKAIKEFFSS